MQEQLDTIQRGDASPQEVLDFATHFICGFAAVGNGGRIERGALKGSLRFGRHALESMQKYGWTQEQIKAIIAKPARTVRTADTRFNEATGKHNNFPATAFIDEKGNYVVIRDGDADVVAMNNRNNPNWNSPFGP